MTNRTKTYVVGLGLLAGTLAIAPAAQAQISVTGGNTSGQAAFFVPTLTPQGNVRLFDTQINTLRLETPNGVTTTSIFTPSAASFSDTNSSGTPNAGDTGTLQGTLAGVAFGANGTPVVFSGRPTVLNFTLNSFSNNIGSIDGTLIRSETPGAAPLVFLPGVDSETLTLQTPGFVDDGGQLQLGDFSAAINTGIIGLPSTFQFLESGSGGGTTTPPTATLLRRIRFDFRGENVLAGAGTDLDATDGSVRFVGPVNERFRIQSVGTRRNSEFKIDGDFGAVDIALNGPIEFEQDGVLDPLQPIDEYRVRGEAEGIFAFYGPTTYGFNGFANRDTRFQFEQATGSVDGRSNGTVNFFASVGLSGSEDDFDGFDGFDFSSSNFTVIDNSSVSFNFSCNLCGSNLVIGSPIVVGGTVVTVGSPIVVPVQPNTPSGGQGGSSSSSTTVINTYINVSSVNSDLFTLVGSSNTALFQYGYVTGYRYLVLGNGLRRGQVFVQVVELNGDRYYLVTQGHGGHGRGHGRGRGRLARGRQSILVAYNQVGPGSRIFPGLVGLREISADDLDELDLDDDDLGFEDTSDDTSDDVSDDTSDDTSDDSADDVSDDTTDDVSDDTTDDVSDDTTDDVSDDTTDDVSDDTSDDSTDDVTDDTSDDSTDDVSDDSTDDVTDDTTDDGSSTGVTVIQGLEEL